MNGLLPIIRRKRRPLIEVDDRPVVVGAVAAAVAAAPVLPVVESLVTVLTPELPALAMPDVLSPRRPVVKRE